MQLGQLIRKVEKKLETVILVTSYLHKGSINSSGLKMNASVSACNYRYLTKHSTSQPKKVSFTSVYAPAQTAGCAV